MKLKLNPIQQTTFFLIVYALFAIGFNWSAEVLIHLGATIGFGLILFFLFKTIFKKPKVLSNTLITTLILFLLLHYGTGEITFQSLIAPLLATFIAVFIKFFLEIKGAPLVNPVVAALLLTYFITKYLPQTELAFISWWGAAFQGYISLALIAAWIVFGLYRWRKLPIVFSFLVFHLIILFFTQSTEAIKFVFSDATIYFYLGIMLIEPRTSPIQTGPQIAYAAIAVIGYNLMNYYKIPHYDLWSIALANAHYFLFKGLQVPSLKFTLSMIGGVGALLLAIVGFIFPIIPGWLFLLAAITLLAPEKGKNLIIFIKDKVGRKENE